MKNFTIIVIGFLTLLCSCTQQQKDTKTTPSKYHVVALDYASTFKIYENENNFKIDWLNPSDKKILVSYTFSKNLSNTPKLTILSSTSVGYLDQLDEIENIVGVENSKNVYNKELVKGISVGKVKEFGNYSMINPENLYKNGINIVFYSLFEPNISKMDEKLGKLNIRAIPLLDWKEEHPLGKAEWLKVYGIIFGKYEESVEIYDEIKREYLSLKKKFSTSNQPKPSVMCGNMFQDVWYFPGGDSFMAKLIEDSGGDYILKDNHQVGATTLTFEQTYKRFSKTPIWINMEVGNKKDLLSLYEGYSKFKAFDEGKMFSYYAQMLKYFEYSSISPERMLNDMHEIFYDEHPKNLYFYQQVK